MDLIKFNVFWYIRFVVRTISWGNYFHKQCYILTKINDKLYEWLSHVRTCVFIKWIEKSLNKTISIIVIYHHGDFIFERRNSNVRIKLKSITCSVIHLIFRILLCCWRQLTRYHIMLFFSFKVIATEWDQ
jgi:hypothetical protein